MAFDSLTFTWAVSPLPSSSFLIFQSLAQVPHCAPALSLWHYRSIGQPENVEITRSSVLNPAGSVYLAANAFMVD